MSTRTYSIQITIDTPSGYLVDSSDIGSEISAMIEYAIKEYGKSFCPPFVAFYKVQAKVYSKLIEDVTQENEIPFVRT